MHGKKFPFIVLVTLSLALSLLMAVPAQGAGPVTSYVAVLSGGEEVPVRDTQARGVATFQLSADGETLTFRLIASNINNVVFAHIHAEAAPGANAAPVVFLLHDQDPTIAVQNGVLATGTIQAEDLIGIYAGSTSLEPLVEAIEDGLAYVNVHTDADLAGGPENTGPGNFRSGEIRGQIQ
jgi:hypothetical protein